jgi:SWI/SNF-related matrix-associated actin-dependent regulator 1 of chromatin subfamily A
LLPKSKDKRLVAFPSWYFITLLFQIHAGQFKVVIADESHYFKNPKAKRTACVLPFLQRAKVALSLTGTPALSRPEKLYTQISALCPSELG